MSVFKEKNGRCEGANLLRGTARFQVSPGGSSISRGLFWDSPYIGDARLNSIGRRSARLVATDHAGVFRERR